MNYYLISILKIVPQNFEDLHKFVLLSVYTYNMQIKIVCALNASNNR